MPIALGEAVDEEHQWNHDRHKPQGQPGEACDALVEGRGRFRLGHEARRAAQIRLLAGGDHDRGARTALHAGAQECHAGEFRGCAGRRVFLDLELLDRKALARQSALVHEQVLRREHAHIGRDHVAGSQRHDVARDEPRNGDVPGLTAADHCRADGNHRLEPGGRAVGRATLR